MAISSLDLFLADLDERKGRLPRCEEVSLIQSRVRKVIKTILLEVRREIHSLGQPSSTVAVFTKEH